MTKGRILELDAFRAVAVLAVIFFHYTFKYHEDFGHEKPGFLLSFGHYGVQLFFIISGYVIFMTVDKVNTAKKFIWLRFTRLYPVYWVSIILTYIVFVLVGLEGKELTFKAFLFNFSMLQGLFDIPNVDGAYWSLLPELMFYLTMVLVILLKLKKYILPFCWVWLICIITASYIELPNLVSQVLNLKYGMLFIAGIQFYLLKNDPNINGRKTIFYWLTLGASLATCFVVFEEREAYILLPLFYALFVALHFDILRFLKLKPLIFIGAISYPLYLTHQVLGYIFMQELALNFWIEITITFVLAIFLGSALHYWVEKPAITKLRTLSQKLKK